MRRGLIAVVAVGFAVIVQLTIVNRIAFPGGSGPDVVLLAAAALALATGPLAGSLIGFTAGLALDVAPPGSHLVGQDALIFCLVGYACGLAADPPAREGVPEQGHTALFEILVTALAALVGEALSGLLGAMLSDPRASWPAIRHVLPIAVLYDVLLCPFALYAAAAALRLGAAPRRAGMTAPSLRAAAGPVGLPQATPRLRLAERGRGDGRAGRPASGTRTLTRREPKLNLSHGGRASARPLGAAFTGGRAARVRFGSGGGGSLGGGRGGGVSGGRGAVFGGRGASPGRGGVLGGSLLGGASALNSSLAGSRLHSSRFGRSRMGRSLLGGSVFSRSSSPFRSPAATRGSALPGRSFRSGRSALLGRSSFPGGRSSSLGGQSPSLGSRPSLLGRPAQRRRVAGQLRSPGGSAAGFAPRLPRRGLLGRFTALLRGPAGRQPRLGQSTFRRGRGALGGGKSGFAAGRRRPGLGAAPARLHMGRSRFGRSRLSRRWRTGGYR
jgi:rod shape-determining protein MreD